MEQLRGLGWGVLATAGMVIGAALGGSLGFATERGIVGLITVAAAVVGAAIGLYIAQLIVSAPSGDEG